MKIAFSSTSITSLRRQHGIAMLMAIMIAALAVTIATAIYMQQRYSIRLTQNIQTMEQAYQYAYAAEHMMAAVLKRDAQKNKSDSLFDDWAQALDPFEIDDDNGKAIGQIEIKLEDMQAYFNINNIYDVKDKKPRAFMMKAYQRLLQTYGLPTSFAFTTLDWIDEDDKLSDPGSAESSYYEQQDPPYKAANHLLSDPAELMAIRLDSVTNAEEKQELLNEILPYAFTLPTPTALNANTADEVALLAVGLTSQQVGALLTLRRSRPIEDINALSTSVSGLTPEASAALGVSSNYFRLTGQVKLGKTRLFLNSVLFRSPEGEVHVIMRQFSRVPRYKKQTDQTNLTGLN
ncbi:MAG: hypothetical protein CR991_05255 [Proteobacteria bacterium]|nr:MAG: hypothetical protein CR991_05255 [Pseudomonadota bacterium]